MGEAKRRKQLLGSRYGKPLGLSSAKRIKLIDQNIGQWISEHFDNCEYHNYLEEPLPSQTRSKSGDSSNLEEVLEEVVEHFSKTFNQEYPEESIKLLIRAILKDQPIVLEGLSWRQRRRVEPTIALPLARKYLQRQVEAQKIQLPTHYRLVKEALTVLGNKSKTPLLKQLLWGELNEVFVSAQESEEFWLIKNINSDGWIDLDEEIVFQSVNRAMAGILTMVATVPWSMHLDFVKDGVRRVAS
ncbi:MAG: hypothetical protein HC939_23430 [Pleurocapsa sp. SU_5_0]|nr:hypothetical protein [Pleurocapsa sp. SU_5_0]NJO98877.1 hypothetical protein [Pleurocapsa sp. CRU_1_2]